jgi:penicillin-binding protein 1A
VSRNSKFIAGLLVIIFIGFFLLGTGLPVVLAEYYRLSLNDWHYQAPAQTALYTSDGQVLVHFGYEREYQADFPPLMKKAVVEMEDRRFYQHGSIDPRGMMRALWVDLRLGEKAQGGSTITQQLARTLFLTNQKSLMRKSKEIIIATALERKYTKDEILNMYLNEIYMGRGVCGMGAAAQTYFGKDVSTLSLGEISYLVAMISAPEYYSPDKNAEALRIRQAVVLNLLAGREVITREDAARALSEKLEIKPFQRKKMKHPYVTVHLLTQLKKEYGEDAVYRGGLKVYTTVDSRMQKLAEEAVASQVKRLNSQGITANDGALVSVQPGTGEVKALVGGADFQRNQVNMAVKPRQPGSAIKPFIYAAAMENGLITDKTELNNRPRDFNGYRPQNSTGNPARATVREALVRSYNVASVEVLDKLGVKEAVRYLEKFGVTTLTKEDENLALGLGGLHRGISPLEMAAGYAVLANDGTWVEPYMIERIEDNKGTLYKHKPAVRQVVSSSVANKMSSMLQDVVKRGTGTSARIQVRAAGKTGTTSDSRDLWFVGYTSDLSTAVWLGNSDNKAIRGVATYGGTRCGPIWRQYMNSLISRGLLAGKGLSPVEPEKDPAEMPPEEETVPPEVEEEEQEGEEPDSEPIEDPVESPDIPVEIPIEPEPVPPPPPPPPAEPGPVSGAAEQTDI